MNKRLSKLLSVTGGSAAETLNQFIMEGITVGKTIPLRLQMKWAKTVKLKPLAAIYTEAGLYDKAASALKSMEEKMSLGDFEQGSS
ncbi:unnamed protein product [Microthlaspi erraticum]|uniref:Uncharacterized protein n=1 Tax=Microthlaspi erraticum TaxID=1685480 RepID=A0A6D2KSA5_9BRAS|nr:unnamed protein product [Microthlaspi erraticum]